MKQILAIDTTTEACSVALVVNQNHQSVRFSRYQIAPRRHAELILAMVDEVLNEAELELEQLDAIAVTIGPGAFTGVRLGVAVAQGLAFSAALKIIPVNTLETLAYAAARSVGLSDCQIAVAMDARMNEVYWGCFEWKNAQLNAITPQQVVAAAKVPLAQNPITESWLFSGTGWKAYNKSFEDLFKFKIADPDKLALPDADGALSVALSHFSRRQAAELISPLYLRDKVAETIMERLANRPKN